RRTRGLPGSEAGFRFGDYVLRRRGVLRAPVGQPRGAAPDRGLCPRHAFDRGPHSWYGLVPGSGRSEPRAMEPPERRHESVRAEAPAPGLARRPRGLALARTV